MDFKTTRSPAIKNRTSTAKHELSIYQRTKYQTTHLNLTKYQESDIKNQINDLTY